MQWWIELWNRPKLQMSHADDFMFALPFFILGVVVIVLVVLLTKGR